MTTHDAIAACTKTKATPIGAAIMLVTWLSWVASASAAAPVPACEAPLRLENHSAVLSLNLRQHLAGAGLGKMLVQKRLAVAVVDLTNPEAVSYAGINDDVMLYAASLPKIGILVSVLDRVHRGLIPWTHEFPYRLRKMITISNNHDASWGFDQATVKGIAEVMRDPRYCFYEPPHGGLWVGRAFRKGSATMRDPLYNISHGATARQTARFYLLLDQEKLVSPYWSRRMLDLMAPPEYVHKFVKSLAPRPGAIFLARKSGTWRTFHADSALIQHHNRRYIVVGLADHAGGEAALRRVAQVVDDIVADGEHRH